MPTAATSCSFRAIPSTARRGTGTSARMAALHARGLLRIGQPWRQESITGTLFTGWLTRDHERLIPHIRGRAFVTGRGSLFFDPADERRGGLPRD